LAKVLTDIGFVLTKADPDVWIRSTVRPDGFKYYEMVFVHKAKEVLEEISPFYKIKEGSLKKPDVYLGANVGEHQLPNGKMAWYTSPREYVANAIKTVEGLLLEDGEGYSLKNKVSNPFPIGYRPELDVTDELDAALASRVLHLIGICRWAVEIGRLDIFLETSLLSQYQANPRVGHLEALYHIFAYMQGHMDMGKIVLSFRIPIDRTFTAMPRKNYLQRCPNHLETR
jgi:hypothetical protein